MNFLGPFKFFLWLPFRKAAAIPVVVIGTLSAAGLYGAFDLSRGVTRLLVQPDPPEKQRSGTSFAAALTTSVVSGSVLLAREMFSKPKMPPKPEFLSFSPEAHARMSILNRFLVAGRGMAHVAKHYPYRFRAVSVFVGGTTGGVTYALTEKARSGPSDEEIALAARMAKLEAMERQEEEEAVEQLGKPREKAAVTSLHTAQRTIKALVGDAKALVEEVKAKQQHQGAAGEVKVASTPASAAVVAAAAPAPAAVVAAAPVPKAAPVVQKKQPTLGDLAFDTSDPFYRSISIADKGNGSGSGNGNGGGSSRRFFSFGDEIDNNDPFAASSSSSSSRVVTERR